MHMMTCSRTVSLVLRGTVDAVPMWLLLVTVVVAIVGVVLGLVWLTRRLVPPVGEGFDAEVASQMLGVVAALFGLLLAFIIVIAYQNYGDTQSSVSSEADALAAIVRDSGASGRECGKARTVRAPGRPSTASSLRFRLSSRLRPGHGRSTTMPCDS